MNSLHRLPYYWLGFLLVTTLVSCLWEQPQDEPQTTVDLDFLWRQNGYANDGNRDGLVHNGILYLPERYLDGMSATRLSDGEVLWRINDRFKVNTKPVMHDGKLYVASKRRSGVPCTFFVLDSTTGAVLGRYQTSITASDPNMIQYEGWLTVYGNMRPKTALIWGEGQAKDQIVRAMDLKLD